jgi:acetate kinase
MESVNILALNCGSSSLKFGCYVWNGEAVRLVREGEAEEIKDPVAALPQVFDLLKQCGGVEPQAIGHRLVHGGQHVREHQRVTPEVLDQLRGAVDFAPLHLPSALAVLEAMQQKFPLAKQVVCLDTAFHRTLPDVARTFALPAEIRGRGVERYGFHGLSLESVIQQLDPVPERLVAAHLGNGSSITAIRNGASTDTTMGLTPTGGVMMGTRCGDLDPGVVTYLARHGYGDPEELEALFDRRSGLLGVSGKSSDVRELLAAREQNREADLALRMYGYQVRKAIAGMAAALGGLDAVVFTGGIGEHAAELRSEICSGLEFLGNFRTLVLPSQEDLQIARTTAGIVRENG